MSTEAQYHKHSQKIKEAMSRMIKNNLQFCMVNLENMSYDTTKWVGKYIPTYKSGKDSYMYTGRICAIISYHEDPEIADAISGDISLGMKESNPSYCSVVLYVPSATLNATGNLHLGFTEGQTLDNAANDLIKYLSGDYPTTEFTMTFDVSDSVTISARIDCNESFKNVDVITKKYYDLMRARGFLVDEEDDEDLGALAAAGGIEW